MEEENWGSRKIFHDFTPILLENAILVINCN